RLCKRQARSFGAKREGVHEASARFSAKIGKACRRARPSRWRCERQSASLLRKMLWKSCGRVDELAPALRARTRCNDYVTSPDGKSRDRHQENDHEGPRLPRPWPARLGGQAEADDQ